jgi:glycosyltransferase involved in cell wall biosynthesis
MGRILIMESGSFKVTGGAARDTYEIYGRLLEDGYSVDIYGDYSDFEKPIKSVTKEHMLRTDYDLVWLNSIRDFSFAERYRALHRSAKFIYIDRGNVITNFRNARLKRALPKMLYRQFLMVRARRWLDYYVAISAIQMEHARQFFRGSKAKLFYIPIAPHAHFKRIKMKRDYWGAIAPARLDERQKRISFMIRGVANILDKHKDLQDKELLRIIGTGRDEAAYRRMVAKLGLGRSVRFYDRSGKELIKDYNNSGFLVSTSEWEGLSRVMLEAMACGLPVLINDRINNVVNLRPERRMVSEGYNGLVYRYGDLDDFASKFFRLYSNRKERNRMAGNAYSFIKEFSYDKVIGRYKEIIEAATGSGKPG